MPITGIASFGYHREYGGNVAFPEISGLPDLRKTSAVPFPQPARWRVPSSPHGPGKKAGSLTAPA